MTPNGKHGQRLHAHVALLLPANTGGVEYGFSSMIVNKMWHLYVPPNE